MYSSTQLSKRLGYAKNLGLGLIFMLVKVIFLQSIIYCIWHIAFPLISNWLVHALCSSEGRFNTLDIRMSWFCLLNDKFNFYKMYCTVVSTNSTFFTSSLVHHFITNVLLQVNKDPENIKGALTSLNRSWQPLSFSIFLNVETSSKGRNTGLW